MFSCHFYYSVWLNTASSFATWSAMFVVLLLMRGEPWSCWRYQRTRGLWSSSRRGWGQFAVFVDAFLLCLLRVCWIFSVLSLVEAAACGGSSLCLKYLNIEKWILLQKAWCCVYSRCCHGGWSVVSFIVSGWKYAEAIPVDLWASAAVQLPAFILLYNL